MGLTTWLKERRLERTHRKLKHLRALQARVREQEAEVHELKKRSAPSTELDAKERKLHEERERLTHQIRELEGAEKQLKAELKATA